MTGVPIFQVLCVNNWFSHWNKFFLSSVSYEVVVGFPFVQLC